MVDAEMTSRGRLKSRAPRWFFIPYCRPRLFHLIQPRHAIRLQRMADTPLAVLAEIFSPCTFHRMPLWVEFLRVVSAIADGRYDAPPIRLRSKNAARRFFCFALVRELG